MLRTLFSATILAGALAGSAMAQAPNAGCALPSEPKGIPAAFDAAISGPADKDRACMKALLIPEARMMFVSIGADGTPSYTIQTLDDWIARVKARGHTMLEEKQLKFHIERYGNIARLRSSYALHSDGKQVAQGRIEHTIPIRFSLDETFDIGEDTGTPVVEDYEAKMPFKFTGDLKQVVIELGKSGLTASDEKTLEELNKKAVVATE
jgi:hypothetical protein